MEDDNRSLNVLYFEDKPESFDTRARIRHNLEVKYVTTADEGIDLLSEDPYRWDAIILDAKMPKSKGKREELSTLQDTTERIRNIVGETVPYYVYSAHGDLLNEILPQKEWQESKVFDKSDDESFEKICRNIRSTFFSNKREETVLKRKYPEISIVPNLPCNPPTVMALLDIIKVLEQQETVDYKPSRDSSIYNKVRKVLEWVFKYLKRLCILLDVDPTATNINECSKSLGEWDMNKYVPVYIQRHIHSLTQITNEGSHNIDVENDTKQGRAPYLVNAVLYEFLSVLHWLINIDGSVGATELRRKDIECILSKRKQDRGKHDESNNKNATYKNNKNTNWH